MSVFRKLFATFAAHGHVRALPHDDSLRAGLATARPTAPTNWILFVR